MLSVCLVVVAVPMNPSGGLDLVCRPTQMNLSPVTNSLPRGIALVAFDGSAGEEFEIFAEEERLLSPGALPRRVTEFRLGRHAAHLALEQLGREPEPILRGSSREPIWPSGVVGSITHSRNLAIALVGRSSDSAGTGVDLENRDRYFPGLETKIAREDEQARLRQLDAARKAEMTLEIFSAKESIYKAFFPRVGRYFGFMTARIEPGQERLTGYFTEPIDPAYPRDRPMEIGRLWLDDSVLTWMVLPPD